MNGCLRMLRVIWQKIIVIKSYRGQDIFESQEGTRHREEEEYKNN